MCASFVGNLAITKEYNVRRHYKTTHASKHAALVEQLQQKAVSDMKKKLGLEQKLLFRANTTAEAADRASFKVAHIIAKSWRLGRIR